MPALTVDTHVGRLSRRLGLTEETAPRKVEDDIAAVFTRKGKRTDWTVLCHRLITLGREVCHSRGPDCGHCPLGGVCPRVGVA